MLNSSQINTTLAWEEGKTVQISSLKELIKQVKNLEKEAILKPFLLDLEVEGAGILSIGLGREKSIASYIPPDLNPPYLLSCGQDLDEGDVVFYVMGDYSDFPGNAVVNINQAKQALEEFFVTKKLPTNIEWQET